MKRLAQDFRGFKASVDIALRELQNEAIATFNITQRFKRSDESLRIDISDISMEMQTSKDSIGVVQKDMDKLYKRLHRLEELQHSRYEILEQNLAFLENTVKHNGTSS